MLNQTIRNYAKKLPFGKKIDNGCRLITYYTHYKSLLKRNNIAEDKMLIIGTIARSGTHYIMLLLANYIEKLQDDKIEIGPNQMNSIFPNNWHLNYMSYHKLPLGPLIHALPSQPCQNIKKIGLTEITRSHSIYQKVYWKKSPVLHLYRNPLDYAVSLYHYKHRKRPELPNRCENADQVLDLKFNNYVDMYKSYREAAKRSSSSLLRISYENLIAKPEFYLQAVLQWLGHEPDTNLVIKSVEAASISKVKKAEKHGQKVNPEAKSLNGSFISGGQVGQWKNHFTNAQFQKWEKKFGKCGVDLNSFILE